MAPRPGGRCDRSPRARQPAPGVLDCVHAAASPLARGDVARSLDQPAQRVGIHLFALYRDGWLARTGGRGSYRYRVARALPARRPKAERSPVPGTAPRPGTLRAAILAELDGPAVDAGELAARLGAHLGSVHAALRRLYLAGWVDRTGAGVCHAPFLYRRTPTAADLVGELVDTVSRAAAELEEVGRCRGVLRAESELEGAQELGARLTALLQATETPPPGPWYGSSVGGTASRQPPAE